MPPWNRQLAVATAFVTLGLFACQSDDPIPDVVIESAPAAPETQAPPAEPVEPQAPADVAQLAPTELAPEIPPELPPTLVKSSPALLAAQPAAVFQEPPPLVPVEPNVYVVEDYEAPVYYTNGHYWVQRNERWYHTPRWDQPWLIASLQIVPQIIIHRDHRRYVRYRDPKATVWHEPRHYHDLPYVFYEPPRLAPIEHDVYVVENYDVPVYYHGGHYWQHKHDRWYRTSRYDEPWVSVEVNIVPQRISRRDHHKYVHYRHERPEKIWYEPRRSHVSYAHRLERGGDEYREEWRDRRERRAVQARIERERERGGITRPPRVEDWTRRDRDDDRRDRIERRDRDERRERVERREAPSTRVVEKARAREREKASVKEKARAKIGAPRVRVQDAPRTRVQEKAPAVRVPDRAPRTKVQDRIPSVKAPAKQRSAPKAEPRKEAPKAKAKTEAKRKIDLSKLKVKKPVPRKPTEARGEPAGT